MRDKIYNETGHKICHKPLADHFFCFKILIERNYSLFHFSRLSLQTFWNARERNVLKSNTSQMSTVCMFITHVSTFYSYDLSASKIPQLMNSNEQHTKGK